MTNVFEALEAEWRRLGRDRAAARTLADVCHRAGQATSLKGIEQHVRQASAAEADRILVALVALVVAGQAPGSRPGERAAAAIDPTGHLAARVLLQLLLPGTRKLARRWWALGDPQERAAAAVAAVYHRIRTYPLARRPGRVAANVLMDAEYDLRRTVPRVIAVPMDDPTAARRSRAAASAVEAAAPNPGEELAELLTDAVDAGRIDRADAELIARSRIADDSIHDIAAERGRTSRTMWHRRQHAEAALAACTPCCSAD
jgi:hypothetical protein